MPMKSQLVRNILDLHVPLAARDYCFQLWENSPFDFKLRKTRLTKVGDFTAGLNHTPRITVNKDLHPFLFLTTYIHEVAHLQVHLQHGRKVDAHGDEWKAKFKELMAPMLDPIIFPEPLLSGLRKHMGNPKASSFSDSELTRLFRAEDEKMGAIVLLSQIPEGSIFNLHGRWFKKGKLQRTRVLCQEVGTKRKYLVPSDSPVGETQLSLL